MLKKTPPSPSVMMDLFAQYKRVNIPNMTFAQYLQAIGFTNPAEGHKSMDDRIIVAPDKDGGPVLLDIPTQPISGQLHVMVLLIDFNDRPGSLNRDHYTDLLFSSGTYPSGSMNDYFDEVSLGAVSITGEVHGWLRMPQNYSFYTNSESGTEWASYPRNAPRMAEDAVQAAIDAGVEFPAKLDKLGHGQVTALFLIHAGLGAETISNPVGQGNEIWSHKWRVMQPISVGPGIAVTTYWTIPNNCRVGVCAHELGHLAFQWQDFYDPNYDADGSEWDGAGRWDLMAGGSYNGDSNTPAHPAGLHKSQHGWVDMQTIDASASVELPAFTKTRAKILKVIGPHYKKGQYLIIENRALIGFDFELPGEGLLIWRIDEAEEQFSPEEPGMLLVQADGRHDLEDPSGWNQGDAGDPFPGTSETNELLETGKINTIFPGEDKSGVSIKTIIQDQITKAVTLDIEIEENSILVASKNAQKTQHKATVFTKSLASSNCVEFAH